MFNLLREVGHVRVITYCSLAESVLEMVDSSFAFPRACTQSIINYKLRVEYYPVTLIRGEPERSPNTRGTGSGFMFVCEVITIIW